MDKLILRFLLRLTVITVVIAITGVIFFGYFIRQYYISVLPLLLVLIYLFTLLTFTWLVKTADKGMGKFTRASMIVTMLRLLFYITVTVLYFAIIKVNAVSFVISLGILYLIYTFFEVSELTFYLRQTGLKEKQSIKGK